VKLVRKCEQYKENSVTLIMYVPL